MIKVTYTVTIDVNEIHVADSVMDEIMESAQTNTIDGVDVFDFDYARWQSSEVF